MKASLFTLVLASASFVGCASDPTSSALSTSHPAHADAKQAACCETSGKTLATHAHGATPSAAPAAADHSAHAGHTAAEPPKTKAIPYPLEVCLVSDEKLGSMGKPFEFIHEGREIKLCCKQCEKDFKKETAKYVKKFDDAVKAKK